jgi:hypothetical protein
MCKRLVVGPDGEIPIAILQHRCENNIKMRVREVGWGAMDHFDLA